MKKTWKYEIRYS